MIAMQVAEIIAEYAVFLELTDDEELNPDTAVKTMEALASYLQEMDKGFLRELVNAFPIIAEEYSGEAQEVCATYLMATILKRLLQLTTRSSWPDWKRCATRGAERPSL